MVPTAPQARPCLPTPSAGIVAARLMGLELERDRWRRVAREWYVKVIAELPGPGKLHHHLYPTIHCTVHMACTLADLMSPAVDMPYLLAYTIRSSFISCSHVHVFDFLACLVSHFIFTCQALFSIKGVECTSINVVVMFSSSLPACPWNRSPFLALSSSVEGHRRFFSHATSATPAVALSLRLYSFLYSSH